MRSRARSSSISIIPISPAWPRSISGWRWRPAPRPEWSSPASERRGREPGRPVVTTVLAARGDIDLTAVRRVAWEGDGVQIAGSALELIADRRARFEAFLADHPERRFYGINVHAGDGSHRALDDAGRADYARGMRSAVSFGDPLPNRVVRGIVLARLANCVEGHSAVTPGLAQAVAAMLDGRELPAVPGHGNGGSGEIPALGALFGALGAERELALKESMSLINGSPCAAALTADAALCAEDLIGWAQRLFRLSAPAYGVDPVIFGEA